jgi:NAD(P)-dependent dehydrogenase (short-subunit alcohol dehydrogenase family)
MSIVKTAVVTGASSGIGLALARAFGERGYNVVANARGISTSGALPAELMRPRGAGHVVAITTSLASQPIAGVPAAEGIRFNAVAPGVVDTPMHAPESHAALRLLLPIARLGTVSEIVDAVLYLEGAAFVTGEILRVDGGAHAGKW